MSLSINVANIEAMNSAALRNVAGLFVVIANYAEGLEQQTLQQSMAAAEVAKVAAQANQATLGSTAPQATPVPSPVSTAMPSPESAFAVPPPPPAPPAGIEVDAVGLPWDGRIHSSSRARVADGTWRMKRGVSPEEQARVTAELRQTMGLPAAAAPVAPAAPFVTNAAPPAPTPAASFPPPPATPPVETASVGAAPTASHSDAAVPPPPPVAPAAPVTPVPQIQQGQATFPALMKAITTAFTSKTLTQEQISAAVVQAGVPSLPMLNARPDLIPTVATLLGLVL